MKKRVRLTNNQKVDIIEDYSEQLTPMIILADRYGITRQGIYKIIRKAGIDTTKRQIEVSCTACTKVILRTKTRIRRRLNHFCNPDCYHDFLRAHMYPLIMNRHKSRIARTLVSQYFQLQQGHTVHHKNRNQTDNRLCNLQVYNTAGDHVRHHRGFDVQPIWDGRNP